MISGKGKDMGRIFGGKIGGFLGKKIQVFDLLIND